MDGSVTINPFIETHHYPLPIIDELLCNKSEAKIFAVLDLKGAYQQLVVSEYTKSLLAIQTIKGLYRFKRLPFGVKPAASIFQSVMDQILTGLENVQVYIDDILIWAKDERELLERIENVLDRLLKFNVKVNWDKCQWFVSKVLYLGHELSEKGISANKEKVRAVVEAPEPQNVAQLKAFLGLMNYYAKFIPNLSFILAPLYNLQKKDTKWIWDDRCRRAFKECKRELCSEKLLTHYDPKKEIIVTTDACLDGVSGVLSHIVKGEERPVFFVSRALTSAERNYPTLHREALAVVFAMEKFYKYVYGHFVKIFSDHKPLEGIFNKGGSSIVAQRLQRYVLRLSIFDYVLKHRPGKDIGHADGLSRLPIIGTPSRADERESKFFTIKSIAKGSPMSLNLELIRSETKIDPELNKVRELVMNGWPNARVTPDLKRYFSKYRELSVEFDCVIYGNRTIIPRSLHKAALKILHANHAGIVRMKQIAREYIYWEGINRDIEVYVKSCEPCQALRKDKPNKEFGKWREATHPLERVHIDFFHFKGQTCLIFIDAYSRWLEIKVMNRTTASKVIQALDSIFCTFGYAETIVSDNGPPFDSHEFNNYARNHEIDLIHSPPYHPQSNGIVERAVQTVKSVLRKLAYEHKSHFQMTDEIENFLFTHRNSPGTEDNIIPSHKMFAFKPRFELTKFRIVKNTKISKIEIEKPKIEKQSHQETTCTKLKPKAGLQFKEREEVLYSARKNGYVQWYPAKIVKRKSEFTYIIKVSDSVKLAHINQLRKKMAKSKIFNHHRADSNTQNNVELGKVDKNRESVGSSDDEIDLSELFNSDKDNESVLSSDNEIDLSDLFESAESHESSEDGLGIRKSVRNKKHRYSNLKQFMKR